jgi:hypothetical protein
MEQRPPITIARAERADLAEVLHVQRCGFSRVARRFDIDPALLPPMRETLGELRSLFDGGSLFFVARCSGDIVGTAVTEWSR